MLFHPGDKPRAPLRDPPSQVQHRDPVRTDKHPPHSSFPDLSGNHRKQAASSEFRPHVLSSSVSGYNLSGAHAGKYISLKFHMPYRQNSRSHYRCRSRSALHRSPPVDCGFHADA